MPDIPWDVISKSQRAAVGMFTGSVGKLVDMGKTGVTRPDELLREVTAMAAAIGDIASTTAKPLEFFITSQKQLAESMAAFAVLQRQMAEVVEGVAASHAAVVDALELMSNPVLGVAHRLRAEDKRVEDEIAEEETAARTSTTKATATKASAKKSAEEKKKR